MKKTKPDYVLREGEDYYIDPDGKLVFTAQYHRKRGFCCRSGCRHCPYGFIQQTTRSSTTPPDNAVKE